MTRQTDPAYLDAVNRTLAALEQNRFDEAIDTCQALLTGEPDGGEGYFLLGLVALRLADLGRALELIETAHQKDPAVREYADALAALHTQAGHLADGLYYAKLSTTLSPHPHCQPLLPPEYANYLVALRNVDPPRYLVDAMLLFNRRDFAGARVKCEAEVRLNKDNAAAYDLLGRILIELGQYRRAIAALHAAIHLRPDDFRPRLHLGTALGRLGRVDEAIAVHDAGCHMDPDAPEAAMGGLMTLAWDMEVNDTALRARQAMWAAQAAAPLAAAPRAPRGGRLRVGLLGNRLYESDSARFLTAFLAYHDESRFEVHGFKQGVANDAMSRRFKTHAAAWREIHDMDDEVVADTIRNSGIDVLIDLAGVGDESRPNVIARHPAPVQVGWLGAAAGLGMPGIDVVLSDARTEAADRAFLAAGQRTAIVEGGLFAVEAPFLMPDVGESPLKAVGVPLFGATAEPARLTPRQVALWTRILRRCPEAHLLLTSFQPVGNGVQERIVEMFAHHGLSNRVLFHTPPADAATEIDVRADFYASIDVLLDAPAPEPDFMVCEALWMGVPVLTRAGAARSSVLGASLLATAGKPAWIAADDDALVDTAAGLVADPDALAAVRGALRGEVEASALFRPEDFVPGFERVLEGLVDAAGGH